MQNTEHGSARCENCERLRAALKPFAEVGAKLPVFYTDDVLWPTQEAGILSGHLRAATRAYEQQQDT